MDGDGNQDFVGDGNGDVARRRGLMQIELTTKLGLFTKRFTTQDRDIIGDVSTDYAAGSISEDEIHHALERLAWSIEAARRNGEPINYPVSVFDSQLKKLAR